MPFTIYLWLTVIYQLLISKVTLERARDDFEKNRGRGAEREKEREERAKKRAEEGKKEDTVSGGRGGVR